jgi:hypothetical protein
MYRTAWPNCRTESALSKAALNALEGIDQPRASAIATAVRKAAAALSSATARSVKFPAATLVPRAAFDETTAVLVLAALPILWTPTGGQKRRGSYAKQENRAKHARQASPPRFNQPSLTPFS